MQLFTGTTFMSSFAARTLIKYKGKKEMGQLFPQNTQMIQHTDMKTFC